eukprot:TRINITY_DN187_c0_g2_i1.p1 TRINITY_DN187_c0_g2~~TRINITY_DN187_c0_g2_i1.p1  ORF type:complete len:123 (-),score=30.16 TRINITY_DN187_c0_g2_i1:95-463(-)
MALSLSARFHSSIYSINNHKGVDNEPTVYSTKYSAQNSISPSISIESAVSSNGEIVSHASSSLSSNPPSPFLEVKRYSSDRPNRKTKKKMNFKDFWKRITFSEKAKSTSTLPLAPSKEREYR